MESPEEAHYSQGWLGQNASNLVASLPEKVFGFPNPEFSMTNGTSSPGVNQYDFPGSQEFRSKTYGSLTRKPRLSDIERPLIHFGSGSYDATQRNVLPDYHSSHPGNLVDSLENRQDHLENLISHPGNLTNHPGGMTNNPWIIVSNPRSLSNHPGGLSNHPGGLSNHPGSLVSSPGSLSGNPGNLSSHPGSLSSHPGDIISRSLISSPDDVPRSLISSPGDRAISPEIFAKDPGSFSNHSDTLVSNPGSLIASYPGINDNNPGSLSIQPGGLSVHTRSPASSPGISLDNPGNHLNHSASTTNQGNQTEEGLSSHPGSIVNDISAQGSLLGDPGSLPTTPSAPNYLTYPGTLINTPGSPSGNLNSSLGSPANLESAAFHPGSLSSPASPVHHPGNQFDPRDLPNPVDKRSFSPNQESLPGTPSYPGTLMSPPVVPTYSNGCNDIFSRHPERLYIKSNPRKSNPSKSRELKSRPKSLFVQPVNHSPQENNTLGQSNDHILDLLVNGNVTFDHYSPELIRSMLQEAKKSCKSGNSEYFVF